MGKKSKKDKTKKKLVVEEDFSDLDDLLENEPVDEPLVDLEEDETLCVSGNVSPIDCEEIRRPLISGHCNFPQTAKPELSHRRCQTNGHGSRANPDKIFQPCPCRCHFPEDEYECECGATIVAAPHYPLDEDGDVRYVHLDPKTGRIVDGECPR